MGTNVAEGNQYSMEVEQGSMGQSLNHGIDLAVVRYFIIKQVGTIKTKCIEE